MKKESHLIQIIPKLITKLQKNKTKIYRRPKQLSLNPIGLTRKKQFKNLILRLALCFSV